MGNSPGGTMVFHTSLSPSGLQASTFLSGGLLAPEPTGGLKRRRGPGPGEIWGWHSRKFSAEAIWAFVFPRIRVVARWERISEVHQWSIWGAFEIA
jgi:hypothetical protein